MKCLALLLLATAFTANAQTGSATTLTVRLFSLRVVRRITLTPAGDAAWMRTCATCRPTPLHAAVTLDSNSTRTHVEFGGLLRAHADGVEQDATAAGSWTVTPGKDGLRILLAVPSERYVAAALAGETAPDEPAESLRAMAIVLRTFALKNRTRHAAEGFHLCDSTHCQALRFTAVRPQVAEAVADTAGETLWTRRGRASVFFSQHCGGMTEDAAAVWPGEAAPHLRAHADPYCLRRSPADWRARIPLQQLQRIAAAEHWRVPRHINLMEVQTKTASGRVHSLRLTGDGEPATISASSLRFAVNRTLGWNTMRSDWYTAIVSGDALVLTGKGYGHGIGLCQAGAFQMAQEKHTAREILASYFAGTSVRIANDSGWSVFDANGANVRSVGATAQLREDVAASWKRAQSLFATSNVPQVTLRVAPTTELFRQMSGQAGWALAATRVRGATAEIITQPLAIIARNSRLRDLLLHEFLHALIEQEAGANAPLWFREGLAEALADPHGGMLRGHFTPTQIDGALHGAQNYQASLKAHGDAGAMVRQMMQRYDLQTMRKWLRDGVPQPAVTSLSLSRDR